jgi:integrase
MLGFYAGLRAGEFASLRMSNLIYDGGYVLCVRKSKTKNGVRNIPLYLLMPDKYLRELVEYWKKEMNTRKPRDYFFTNNGKMLNSKKMATLVAGFFLDSLGISMRNHYLRHSFASWFLIRWFAATYGKNFFDPACSFLKEDLFDEEYLKRIRHLLYGFRILQRGQENFSHIFAALARLVGHGSPRITIKNYIHVIDFLTHLYFRKKYNNPQVKMTSKKLAVLLNVSHATLPLEFRGKSLKVIRVEDIVKFQKERLRLSNN